MHNSHARLHLSTRAGLAIGHIVVVDGGESAVWRPPGRRFGRVLCGLDPRRTLPVVHSVARGLPVERDCSNEQGVNRRHH